MVSAQPAKPLGTAPSAHPHRLSIDVDNDTYRRLCLAAAGRGTKVVTLVCEAITQQI